MSRHLLFVCAANVCRSPLMALTFTEALAHDPDPGEWTVISRGISVVRTHPMCRLAASMIEVGADGAPLAASHVSSQIAESELEHQDLIITASREERARLARMLPSARTRTFTLKEAVALGRPPLDASERERALRAGGGASLSTYADLLHQRRGRVPLPAPPRLRLPWTASDDPLDVPDVHHDHSRRHARTLKETRGVVQSLHGQIDDFFSVAH
jgi:protein-tyrosine phosphatase